MPCGAEHPRDRRLDALVRIRDHELDPGQATALQLAQELDPERLGLRGADRHAEDFAAAVGVDRDGEGHGDRDNAPGLAHLHVGGVDPQIGPVALDRPLEERTHTLVDRRPRRLTWLLEMPAMPSALTSSSTQRVEMPCT